MKPGRYKIYFIASLLVAFGGAGAAILAGWAPREGLDLAGGVSIIMHAEGEGSTNSAVLDKTVEILRDRIDKIGAVDPDITRAGSDNILIQLPGLKNEDQALKLVGTTAQLTFRQVEATYQATDKKAPDVTKDTDSSVNDETVVYPGKDDNTLYKLKPAVLTGDVVTKAEAVINQTTGNNWSVSIDMNDQGAKTWASFTSDLACLRDKGETVKSQVAIVLDGRVQSAAGMKSPQEAGASGGVVCGTGIAGGKTSIDVGDETEAKNLALVLQTGALPITLKIDQVQKVSPTLGRDSLSAGLTAGFLGLGLVMIYVLLYYRALGLIVWLGLAEFTALIYAILAFLGHSSNLSLSLAGIAGIIVSIGVTADSFIVSFERLKDEVHSGKSMRAAIERGMARGFKTVLVADAVTGVAAVILFFLAVGPVRGFALTLGISTVIDVAVTYYFTRPAVNLLGRTKWFTEGRFIGVRNALGLKTPPPAEVAP
ncbi:MAG TPA: protein translocase subunit SecD [Actinomycetota bacterium]|nr:protein translocase subunit SecD [Actinomycetota bacterium]